MAHPTLHRYGGWDPDRRRGGRRGQLDGQDYWLEIGGERWEVESRAYSSAGLVWTATTEDGKHELGTTRRQLLDRITDHYEGAPTT